MRSKWLGCLVVAGSSLLGPNVRADDAASSRAAAETLFEEGVRLAEQGRMEDACRKFEASEGLDVAVGTLLRLADCRERTGRLASAWARFREAGSLAETLGMTERARIAAVRSAALEPKLTRLRLQVPADAPEELVLTIDGTAVPRASWSSSLPVDPGTLSVEASAPGYLPYRRYVAIPSEESSRVDVTIPRLERRRTPVLRSERTSPAALRVSDEDRGYAARVMGVSLLVAGGVGLATSGALALVAQQRNDDSLEYCPNDPTHCAPRGVQLRSDAGRLADYATVAAAVGGGLLVTGLVVYVAAPSGEPRERVSLGVVPAGAGGVGLRAAGAF
jgi:serine/threonine-protein kinase